MNISIKSTTINNKKQTNIINHPIHFNVCFVNLNYTYINYVLTNLANRLHNYQTSLFYNLVFLQYKHQWDARQYSLLPAKDEICIRQFPKKQKRLLALAPPSIDGIDIQLQPEGIQAGI